MTIREHAEAILSFYGYSGKTPDGFVSVQHHAQAILDALDESHKLATIEGHRAVPDPPGRSS